MALVDDEYGSIVGIVTMENVVEQIVGAVQDEFDSEAPEVEQESPGVYLVNGSVPLERLNREVRLSLESTDVDTLSGLLVSRIGRLLEAGDTVELEGATAEVMEEQGGQAVRVKLTVQSGDKGVDS